MIRFQLKKAATMIAVCSICLTGCGAKEAIARQAQYRAEGIKYLQEQNYEEAEKAFQKGLDESVGEICKDELDLCFLKAKALYLQGKTEEALKVYNAILGYEEHAETYYLRGNLYYAMGEESLALADYEKAVSLEGTGYEIYIHIYDSLMAHNQKALAEEYLNKALSVTGKNACSDLQRGRIYYSLGDEKKALEYLEKAYKEGDKEASYYIAMIYMNASDDRAQEYFDAFLKTEYATSDRLFEIGDQAMMMGQYDQAVVYFEAAQKQKGTVDEQILMRNLVIAYEKTANYEAAETLLTEYVELYPADDEAKRELIFLKTR